MQLILGRLRRHPLLNPSTETNMPQMPGVGVGVALEAEGGSQTQAGSRGHNALDTR